MPGAYLSTLPLAFAAFRLGVAAALALLAWRLYRKPSPLFALVAILVINVAASVAYLVPLQRPYGLGPGSDRAFNLGMVASTAVGNSPFEHTQVGFGSPEPLWNAVLAVLAGFDPTRAAQAYDLLSQIALVVVALGLYFGVNGPAPRDRWDGFWVVFAVLELASLTMGSQAPVPPFWPANFLLKPQHGLSLGLVGLVVLARSDARRSPVALGLLLGATAWSFLMTWAYVVPGLLLAALLSRPIRPALRRFAVCTAVSFVIAAPLILHLASAFHPLGTHGAARHMWQDVRGLPLAVPNWTTLDLGPLLTLGVAGAWLLRGRSSERDLTLVGLLGAAWLLWALSLPAALLGLAPEPDELHYYVRFVTAVSAGLALAAAARWIDRLRSWPAGRASALAVLALTPVAFHTYWDPPTMDRYYREGVLPIGTKKHAAAAWILDNTEPQAVFVAGPEAASWLPALTGRRVLLNEAGPLLPPDYAARKEVERILLTSENAEQLRLAAGRYGITHLAIDAELRADYPRERFPRIAASRYHRTVLLSSAVRLVELAAAIRGSP